MKAIELVDVSLRFDEVAAVSDMTFDVQIGEIVGLLGHNGAGKTTLLRIINGLLRPDHGAVRVLGHDPLLHGREVRSRTGVLTEYPALDEYLSPAENLEVYAAINDVPRSIATARIDSLLGGLGLDEKRAVPSRDLSAGLKQRVALARALVHDPEVLLLDEPTTNMDPVAARGVRGLIRDAARRRGHTVLLSTHNIREAEELCDRVAIVRSGRLLSLGPPAQLRRGTGSTQTVLIGTDPGQAARVRELLDDRVQVELQREDSVYITGRLPIADLVAQLVSGGISVHRVEPQEPSLEDLYLQLHGERSVVQAIP